MSSINTNVAAMTALQSLTATNKALTETQNRISTGFRVADASDNAAYWSIATTMRSDNAALSTVQDALGLGAATVDVAYTGVESAIKVVDQIKSKLVAARQPGVDRGKIQSEITELQSQLQRHRRTPPRSRARTGCRWTPALRPTMPPRPSCRRFRARMERSTSAPSPSMWTAPSCSTPTTSRAFSTPPAPPPTAASTISIAGEADALDISALTDSDDDLADLEEIIGVVDAAMSSMTDSATALGAAKARVGIQQDFVKGLMDAIGRGIGQLVDADMNEESTRLQALQVKQQLGVQALSIANSSSQTILQLFR